MATYHFDTQDARDYGVDGAIILYNLSWWIAKNAANKRNFFDGRYWTHNSTKAFVELFPFWNQQKIGRILRKLEADGAIISGNYNKAGYDKTKWYSVIKSACLNLNNGTLKSEQPIPDSKPDSKQHISSDAVASGGESADPAQDKSNQKPNADAPSRSKSVEPPELAEVLEWAEAWARKKGKPVVPVKGAARKAFDYYDRLDWKDSRGAKVKSWKQKIVAVWFTDEKIGSVGGVKIDVY